jgi:hypothetical protein
MKVPGYGNNNRASRSPRSSGTTVPCITALARKTSNAANAAFTELTLASKPVPAGTSIPAVPAHSTISASTAQASNATVRDKCVRCGITVGNKGIDLTGIATRQSWSSISRMITVCTIPACVSNCSIDTATFPAGSLRGRAARPLLWGREPGATRMSGVAAGDLTLREDTSCCLRPRS